MRISDWSSDVCSSDLSVPGAEWRGVDLYGTRRRAAAAAEHGMESCACRKRRGVDAGTGMQLAAGRRGRARLRPCRSEAHTSELQSLMRISYAVFCLNKQIVLLLNIDNIRIRAHQT